MSLDLFWMQLPSLMRYFTHFEVPALDEVLTELSRPAWWVSVVIVGILINLLSAYLKNPLDRFLSSTSSMRKSRYEKRMQQWDARIRLLRESPEARQREAASELRLRLQSIHMLLLSVFFIIVWVYISGLGLSLFTRSYVATGVSGFVLGMSSFLFFASFLAFKQAVKAKEAVAESSRASGVYQDRTT